VSALLETLKQQRKGAFIEELEEKFSELVHSVHDVNKAGKITITLKLKPLKPGVESDTVTLEDEINLTTPKPDKKASVFYATPSGTLSRTDPNQMEMKLDVIKDDEKEERKEANGK